ncbi:hypothetical protein AVEN_161497-1 [Araneus ventricosus]|uniref:Uncharacterized protein n=1 Tax=Araneus ventricosus TaxID=182803 RepID=A0A4Y2F5D6_ARAVE|nr:hypothetical protein AVEN_255451-1 [Araneus ventricosus]GBM35373.1 hypothetical protein AVEN_18029-1 [Araneus ventricosus]GBM35516.1 hypothetical protein AVEN_150640-1 [Araneus ventricosus]GBM35536.1 hypothetical protein AVEN_161497-1 [Araneus ventricosus]
MAFLYKTKKNYLRAVAEKLSIEVTQKMIKTQIIKAIVASEHFEEQFVLNVLEEEGERTIRRRKEALEEENMEVKKREEMRKLKIGEEENRWNSNCRSYDWKTKDVETRVIV